MQPTYIPGYPIAPPAMPEFVPHVQWSGANRMLSGPECEAVIALGLSKPMEPAAIGSNDARRIDPSYRKVDVSTLHMGDAPWLFERVGEKVKWTNETYYGFDLVGVIEPIQFLRYEAMQTAEAIPGHYDWHQDFGAGAMATRKLSLVIQLSDPATYKGCRLRCMTHYEWECPYINQGDAVVFPSWTPHRVLPIEDGVRYALAVWVHGPRFR